MFYFKELNLAEDAVLERLNRRALPCLQRALWLL